MLATPALFQVPGQCSFVYDIWTLRHSLNQAHGGSVSGQSGAQNVGMGPEAVIPRAGTPR
jgi:hypothetical protein